MTTLKATYAIDSTIFDENYSQARVLVFEGTKLIVSEKLKDLLHKTYKMLENYVLTEWTTDWKVSGNQDINTLVLFVEKVSA